MARVVRLPNRNNSVVYGIDFEHYAQNGIYSFPETGITKGVGWSNLDIQNTMRALFRIGPNERLVGIEVDDLGIRAHIIRVPERS